jgi:hypothetical protein
MSKRVSFNLSLNEFDPYTPYASTAHSQSAPNLATVNNAGSLNSLNGINSLNTVGSINANSPTGSPNGSSMLPGVQFKTNDPGQTPPIFQRQPIIKPAPARSSLSDQLTAIANKAGGSEKAGLQLPSPNGGLGRPNEVPMLAFPAKNFTVGNLQCRYMLLRCNIAISFQMYSLCDIVPPNKNGS